MSSVLKWEAMFTARGAFRRGCKEKGEQGDAKNRKANNSGAGNS